MVRLLLTARAVVVSSAMCPKPTCAANARCLMCEICLYVLFTEQLQQWAVRESLPVLGRPQLKTQATVQASFVLVQNPPKVSWSCPRFCWPRIEIGTCVLVDDSKNQLPRMYYHDTLTSYV